jgi:transketolase
MLNKLMTQKANQARKRILELGLASGRNGAHFGSSLSLVDIMTVLYDKYIVHDLRCNVNRNRFILSKGHGALGYFSVLEQYGYLTEEQTSLFEKNGSNFFAHPHRNLENGIEFSGGSLGLGVSYSVGVALANKLKGIDSQVIVLAGDGECDEGIVWEALMTAAHYKLNNFTLIVDQNSLQSDGFKSQILDHGDLVSKLTSFGISAVTVNGHNHQEIDNALNVKSVGPNAIVANTIKGYGVDFMESNPDWHHGVLTQKLFDEAIKQIGDL